MLKTAHRTLIQLRPVGPPAGKAKTAGGLITGTPRAKHFKLVPPSSSIKRALSPRRMGLRRERVGSPMPANPWPAGLSGLTSAIYCVLSLASLGMPSMGHSAVPTVGRVKASTRC